MKPRNEYIRATLKIDATTFDRRHSKTARSDSFWVDVNKKFADVHKYFNKDRPETNLMLIRKIKWFSSCEVVTGL